MITNEIKVLKGNFRDKLYKLFFVIALNIQINHSNIKKIILYLKI